jgi:hypothetical protein
MRSPIAQSPSSCLKRPGWCGRRLAKIEELQSQLKAGTAADCHHQGNTKSRGGDRHRTGEPSRRSSSWSRRRDIRRPSSRPTTGSITERKPARLRPSPTSRKN